jgi:hypothetical protein
MSRTLFAGFAVVGTFLRGGLMRPSPSATAQAVPIGGHGKCIGVTSVQLMVNTVVAYRAFEDGTVESSTNTGKWQFVGK